MNLTEEIQRTLIERWPVTFIGVEDESHQHAVPKGVQSHFKVTLVTESFAGLSLVNRHRAVYQALASFLRGGVHALALHTYTPEEWAREGQRAPSSPDCKGSSHREVP